MANSFRKNTFCTGCRLGLRNSPDGVYKELEDIGFPVEEAEKAMGTEPSTLGRFIMDLAHSLKVPFGAVVLGIASLASFMGHRTATVQNC